jgi:hypothetical protein
MRGRRLRCLVLAAALSTVSGAGRAEPVRPSDDDRTAAARAAYEEGLGLGHEGRWSEALAALGRSQSLRPHPMTSYNIGFCELSLRHYARAKKAFTEALAARTDLGASGLPEDVQRGAAAYLGEAEQSLAAVRVTLDPPEALLAIDGGPLELTVDAGVVRACAGTRERGAPEQVPGGGVVVEMDPGVHVFRLALPGAKPREEEHRFSTAERAELTLRIARPVEPRPTLATRPVSAQGPRRAEPRPSRVPAYVALGVGTAGVLTGAAFGAAAMVTKSSLADQCPDGGCPSGGPTSTLDRANGFATIATVGFVVGAAGLATGGYLWLTAPASSSPRSGASKAPSGPTIGWRTVGYFTAF